MNDQFDIPVNYKGEEILFPARVLKHGYIFRIEVQVQDVAVWFERDEERNWRALVEPGTSAGIKEPDTALIRAIAEVLDEATS